MFREFLKEQSYYLSILSSICLAPYFIFYNHNYEQITFYKTLQPLLLVLCLLFCLILNIFFVSRAIPRLEKLFSVFLIIVTLAGLNFDFFYNDLIKENMEYLKEIFQSKILLFIIACLLSCAVLQILKIKFFKNLIFFLCIFSLLTPLSQITLKILIESDDEIQLNQSGVYILDDNQLQNSLNENVYFILLDGYASEKTFSRMSFDNQYFYNYLQENNFLMLGDRAAYDRTYLSLSAIFYLDYPIIESTKSYRDRSNFFPYFLNKAEAPPLVESFKKLDYEFIFYGNSWSNCNPKHFICGSVAKNLSYPSWVTYESWIFLSKTIFSKLIEYELGFDAIQSFTNENFDKITGKNSKFYFIHHLSPHPPYLSKDCHMTNNQSMQNWEPPEDYLSTVQCVNIKFMKLVSMLNKKDPSALIVVQSDHGPITSSNWLSFESIEDVIHIDNRLSIINGIKIPEKCNNFLKDLMGPVNTARFLVSCISQQPLLYLEERSFESKGEGDKNYGKVKEYFNQK